MMSWPRGQPMGLPSFDYITQFDADLIFEHDGCQLYLGSMDAAQSWEELEKRNIKKIISVLDFGEPRFSEKIPYLWIKLQDEYDWSLISAFELAIEHIEDVIIKKKDGEKASVLVHCAAGISRSTTIVIAFLMKTQKMTFMDAWRATKQSRQFACPNGQFQYQLSLWEKIGCKLDKEHPDVKEIITKRKIPTATYIFGDKKYNILI